MGIQALGLIGLLLLVIHPVSLFLTTKTDQMRPNTLLAITVTLLLPFQNTKAQDKTDGRQQYISIGDFTLESGQKILDCKIGYRAYGKLNSNKSNIIIFPSWFTGTAKDLEAMVPGKMIDTTAFYVMLIDALGDGCSSSPDNSLKQSRLQFPSFTIRDMVESQYKMLAYKMGIQHLVAVAGISMGGMQAFQWAVSHPDFMDKVIPIVGSPQLSTNDLLLWNGELQAMVRDTAYHNGNYTGRPPLPPVTIIHNLAVGTPENITNSVSRAAFNTWFAAMESSTGFDWNNWHRQLEAMINHDVTKTTGGSLSDAAKMIKAKMLIIVAKQDHMVNPIPATQFAALLPGAKLLELQGDCGHKAVGCEMDKVIAAVGGFLKE